MDYDNTNISEERSVYELLHSVLTDENGKELKLEPGEAYRVASSRSNIAEQISRRFKRNPAPAAIKIIPTLEYAGITVIPWGLRKMANEIYVRFNPEKEERYDEIERNLNELSDEDIMKLGNFFATHPTEAFDELMPMLRDRLEKIEDKEREKEKEQETQKEEPKFLFASKEKEEEKTNEAIELDSMFDNPVEENNEELGQRRIV